MLDVQSMIYSFSLCLLLSILYVGSLYLKPSPLPRNHPSTIKQRTVRVTIACIFCCYIGYHYSYKNDATNELSLWQWMGIRTDHIVEGTIYPLLLFLMLFLGPIYMAILDGDLQYFHPKLYYSYTKDWIYWRNFVVAPLSEETVFRGCMLPILVPSFGCSWAVLLAPSFFGVAHVHHALEKYYREQYPLQMVVVSTIFQAFYTTLFGALSSFVFLRTGHLIGIILCHSFCNIMGFPDMGRAWSHRYNIRICISFILGLILFIILLRPLTSPELYSNYLYKCWS